MKNLSHLEIVCIRRNKGNFMSESNSNRIKLCGGGGQHYLVLNKILTF